MKINKQFSAIHMGDVRTELKGKQVVIVGGTGGLGRTLAQNMAKHGADVLVVGRTFRDQAHLGIRFLQADLSSMREAERVATIIPAETLDMLIFTTGIFAAPKRQETAEGLEMDMATSYLNRLLMLDNIMPRLGKQTHQKPRVFVMGYPGSGSPGVLGDLNAEQSYKTMQVHMNTVAGNEMLVLDNHHRFQNFSIFGLNPGLVKTDIRSNFLGGNRVIFNLLETLIGWFTPTPEQYAQGITPLLIAPELDQYSGTLFNQKSQALLPTKGINADDHMQAYLLQSRDLIAKALA
ncbi:SDR family NAD(P)-dependent oxidoreductase [Shewanella mangrovisoli]|uniref:SDR family NAD(P)-dependent oxidoreductase n=1 Tax=Shewanella mangrovisoli TaxID=2864211 RepID=UPI0035B811B8